MAITVTPPQKNIHPPSSRLPGGIAFGRPSNDLNGSTFLDFFFVFNFRVNTAKCKSSSFDAIMTVPIDCVPCVKKAIVHCSVPPGQAVSTLAAVAVKPNTVGSKYFGSDAKLSDRVEIFTFGPISPRQPKLPTPRAQNNRSSKSP